MLPRVSQRLFPALRGIRCHSERAFKGTHQMRLLSDWSIRTLVPRFLASRSTENLINKHGCRRDSLRRADALFGFVSPAENATEGRISTFLCLITCSRVLFKSSKCSASVIFSEWREKKEAGGVLRARKRFFFCTCKSGGREKRALRTEKIKLLCKHWQRTHHCGK